MNIVGFERITIDPRQMNGQPCVRGLRLTLRRVLEIIALCPDREQLFSEFPELGEEDLNEALLFAAASLAGEIAYLE